jgi:hypothetical protein
MAMGKNSLPLRYVWLTFRRDQLWFPWSIWLLFAIVAWMMRNTNGADVAAGYLGIALPLISGILSAYAFLDDPALEMTFSTRFPAQRLVLIRIGTLLAMDLLVAASFQAVIALLGIDLSPYGSLLGIQLLWAVPCLATSALGCLAAFLAAQPTFGAMLTGLVWIVELILHGWFENKAAAHYFFVMSGFFGPGQPWLAASQLSLTGLGVLFLAGSLLLIRRQERYIGLH